MTDAPPDRPLTIRLTKRTPPKPPLLAAVRANGSQTITELNIPPVHDLAHYAVETTLNLRNSFFSLLARGMNIQDFNVPAATTRLDLPAEAVWTEHVVNFLMIENLNGAPFDDFNAELRRTIAAGAARKPNHPACPSDASLFQFTITDAQLATIRRTLADLIARWNAVPVGGTLELTF